MYYIVLSYYVKYIDITDILYHIGKRHQTEIIINPETYM